MQSNSVCLFGLPAFTYHYVYQIRQCCGQHEFSPCCAVSRYTNSYSLWITLLWTLLHTAFAAQMYVFDRSRLAAQATDEWFSRVVLATYLALHQQSRAAAPNPHKSLLLSYCEVHSGRCEAYCGSFCIPFMPTNFEAVCYRSLTICFSSFAKWLWKVSFLSISPVGRLPFSDWFLRVLCVSWM